MRQTSIDAYHKITEDNLLPKRRLEVYEVLFKHGPLTASELAEHLPKKVSRTIGSNVHARLAELRDSGVAIELGTTICTVSGMNVIRWDVTPKLPVPYKKKTKTKCPHCDGTGYVSEGK